jgi:prevent-host-death family protein
MPKAKNPTNISRAIPALTARTQFGQILKRVQQNKERFVVDKRGEPQAVIMSIDEYLQNFVKSNSLIDEIHEHARRKGLHHISMRSINREIKKQRRERRKTNG